MRHRVRGRRLSRNTSARKALLRSLTRNLLDHHRIRTSLVKAKEARRVMERLITLGKENTLHARRKAYKILNDRDKVKSLFTEIAPLFKNRTGGYTRIIRVYPRRGDGSEMVFLELTEQPVKKEVKKTRKKKAEEKEGLPKTEKKPEKKPEKKEAPEAKAAPPPAHEKKALEPRKEERPSKRPPKKGFFKNLRQYFKRKSMD